MNCPLCGRASSVIATRGLLRSEVERRRECDCGARWTTYEAIDRTTLIAPLTLTNVGNGANRQKLLVGPPGGEGGVLSLTSVSSPSGQTPDPSQPISLDLRSIGRPTRRKRRPAYTVEFLAFWAAYPNKVKKLEAAVAWEAERPDLAVVLAALKWQSQTPDWTKDGGEYIPHPSTWLNGHRWEDEGRAKIKALSPAAPGQVCEFHRRADNRERAAPKPLARKECPECQHTGSLLHPRASSEPAAIGDLLSKYGGAK